MTTNLSSTLILIERLSELVNIHDRSRYIIFGSAAIALHGVDLNRSIDDLDVFVSEGDFSLMKDRFGETTKVGGDGKPISVVVPAPKIELLDSFPGVTYENVVRMAKPLDITFGFPVGCLEDLYKWKTTQGRKKDLLDAQRINSHTSPGEIAPQILRHILNHLPALLIRDALLDLLTASEKTKARLLDDSHAVVDPSDRSHHVYTAKLLDIDGQLYRAKSIVGIITASDVPIDVEPLNLSATSQLCRYNSKIELQPGDLANYKGDDALQTTIGRLLLNYVFLVDPFGDLIPYINKDWKISELEGTLIFDNLRAGKITVEQLKHYSRNAHWLGHLTELSVPSFTKKSLIVDPAIIARRDELLHQHRAALEAGDAVVMNQIETELIAMDRAYMKGDVSTLFYDMDSKSYEVHRKMMMISGGMIPEFGGKGYNFINSSLEEGWKVKNFDVICNEVRRGSFATAKQTADGGTETKFVIRVFQNTRITEDDCHSQNYLPIYLSKDVAKKYLYRNVFVDGKLLTLDDHNLSDYTGRVVLLRSPMYCHTKAGYCFTCAGELFRTIDQELLTMVGIALTSTFTRSALKSKHFVIARGIEIKSLNKFVI